MTKITVNKRLTLDIKTLTFNFANTFNLVQIQPNSTDIINE
ncbi:hypothetical protein PMAN_b0440 [Pseudoalteromonas marina]|nr:hypothetical protein PMAN_b0440 [Pseudoalteromonas marina]